MAIIKDKINLLLLRWEFFFCLFFDRQSSQVAEADEFSVSNVWEGKSSAGTHIDSHIWNELRNFTFSNDLYHGVIIVFNDFTYRCCNSGNNII